MKHMSDTSTPNTCYTFPSIKLRIFTTSCQYMKAPHKLKTCVFVYVTHRHIVDGIDVLLKRYNTGRHDRLSPESIVLYNLELSN